MTDRVNVHDKDAPQAEITTQAQALGWVEELILDMVKWRTECNIIFPESAVKTAKYQRKALWTFLQKQGQVVGALKTLRLCGMIPERAFAELNQKAINVLAPTTLIA